MARMHVMRSKERHPPAGISCSGHAQEGEECSDNRYASNNAADATGRRLQVDIPAPHVVDGRRAAQGHRAPRTRPVRFALLGNGSGNLALRRIDLPTQVGCEMGAQVTRIVAYTINQR